MKTLLSICFVFLMSLSFAQVQPWKSVEDGHIPDGLKETNATLVCIKFSNADIKNLGLHPKFTSEIYNKFVVKYAEKYFTGKIKYISMAEFIESKDEFDFVFLPMIYEPGRAEGIAPRTFCVVDVKNETAYSRIDRTGSYITAGSMKSELLLEMKFLSKQRKE